MEGLALEPAWLGYLGTEEVQTFPSSFVPKAAGQGWPHSGLGPLSLRASFWWVVWASCHQPELTLSH